MQFIYTLEKLNQFNLDLNGEIIEISAGNCDTLITTTTGDCYELCFEPRFSSENPKAKKLNVGNVIKAKVAFEHRLVLTNEGKVYSYGYNNYGHMGIENLSSSQEPVLIEYFTQNNIKIIDIEVGCYQSYCISSNHDLYAFGYNSSGEIGLPDGGNIRTPTKIASNVKRVLSGDYAFFFFYEDFEGNFFGSGSNSTGQLGISKKISTVILEKIPELKGKKVIEISCGYQHSAAVIENEQGFHDVLIAGGPFNKQNLKFRKVKGFENRKVVGICSYCWDGSLLTNQAEIYNYNKNEDFVVEKKLTELLSENIFSFRYEMSGSRKIIYSVAAKNMIVEDFENFLKSQEFSDISIRGNDGSNIKAHKFILNGRICYPNEIEFEKLIGILNEKDKNQIEEFLSFVYTGKCHNSGIINEIGEELGIESFYQKNSGIKKILEFTQGMYYEEESKDFKIIVQNEEIKVHKMILIIRSDLYRGMFLSVVEDLSNKVSDYTGRSIKEVKSIIKFLYFDEIDEDLDEEMIEDFQDKAFLLKKRPIYLRFDITPFGFIYLYLLKEFFQVARNWEWETKTFTVLSLPFTILFQIVLLLSSHWSLSISSRIKYSIQKSIETSDYIAIFPQKNFGSPEIVKIQKDPKKQENFVWNFRTEQNKNENEKENQEIFYNISFLFQKTKYVYQQKGYFKKIDFPTKWNIGDYLEYFHRDIKSISSLQSKYGNNQIDFPNQTFKELFIEHALAPFFVFQVFCILLWTFDEYWYFSLFTLLMLIVFESNVVRQRLRNFDHIRKMQTKPTNCNVFREGKWKKILTTELIPGDIISVVKNTTPTCDLLLLSGKCVVNESMLTGESVPLLKESIMSEDKETKFNTKDYKIHVIFAGTTVVQSINEQAQEKDNQNMIQSAKYRAPEKGCPAFVLKTGFATDQGKLLKKIFFGSSRVTANNKESLLFILLLLVFALFAAAYLLYEGLKKPDRNIYKLVLEATLIVTSVVPPELPMELSLAVNTSLQELSKLNIFCTEPFRIPFAGKVDVCCFDKTGTLTSDKIKFEGIKGLEINNKTSRDLIPPHDIPLKISTILAGCHSLMTIDRSLVGDPTEVVTIKGIKWILQDENTTISPQPRSGKRKRISIIQRFPFLSKLKRMTTVVKVTSETKKRTLIITKGAPEMIKNFLVNAPENYDEIYRESTLNGSRVLAIAYKEIEENSDEVIKEIPREQLESGLIFSGFLVFAMTIKPGTQETIDHLLNSSHSVVMITGDNILTAVHVARKINILEKQELIVYKKHGEQNAQFGLEGRSIDDRIVVDLSKIKENELKKYELCVTGEVYQYILESGELSRYLEHINVYARVLPDQKESVILEMKKKGKSTLMCGDGTNDVRALKESDVGIALLNSGEIKKTAQPKRAPQSLSDFLDAEDTATIQLGDASMASPFTSKLNIIDGVVDVIKQGRCTLVTTLQMYKILALNCLVAAYSLSVLYLQGLKFGDRQMTLTGIVISICFFFLTRAKPLRLLSPERPFSRVFSPYILITIFVQFALHLLSIILLSKLIPILSPYRFETDIDLAKEFEPSIFNSSMYILSVSFQATTFLVNYMGYPFMQGLLENKFLSYLLFFILGLMVMLSLEILPPLNSLFQLAPFRSWKLKLFILVLIFFDLLLSFAFDRLFYYIFKFRPHLSQKRLEIVHQNFEEEKKRIRLEKEKQKEKEKENSESGFDLTKFAEKLTGKKLHHQKKKKGISKATLVRKYGGNKLKSKKNN
ncbi:manganese-transporting atpase 13a1 [Anaeramoeba ignava]|uniref:Manganese-transporting atpase 13a1 n=1 Tax=Anaeramoeba ignava TaxID=1746090 RepID=A0A9Q0L8Z5_ANAIG|nr:manganese-transporting atpase 13a1 [Anaeramoeba ignava]